MAVRFIKPHRSVYVFVFAMLSSLTVSGPSSAASATEAAKTDVPNIRFDVVSIRQNKSETEPPRVIAPHGGDTVTFQNYPLAYIVMFAYNFHRFDLAIGFPEWTRSERYDISAKVASDDVQIYKTLNLSQREQMFQEVLEDRFKLQAHLELREALVYNLVVAKGGPKLKEASPNATYPDGLKSKYGQNIMFTGPTELQAQSATTSDLALMLSDRNLGRQVIDKTGLTGKYDFDMKWQEDQPSDATPSDSQRQAAIDDASGSLFTAIQERLGLKLENGKGEVQYLVVESIAHPSEN